MLVNGRALDARLRPNGRARAPWQCPHPQPARGSAPEILVQRVVNKLTDGKPGTATQLEGVEEHVTFGLPKELRE